MLPLPGRSCPFLWGTARLWTSKMRLPWPDSFWMDLGWVLGDQSTCRRGGPDLVLLQAVPIPCSPLLPGSRVLHLPHLQLSSSGTYTCMALNVASQDEKSFILTVHGEW